MDIECDNCEWHNTECFYEARNKVEENVYKELEKSYLLAVRKESPEEHQIYQNALARHIAAFLLQPYWNRKISEEEEKEFLAEEKERQSLKAKKMKREADEEFDDILKEFLEKNAEMLKRLAKK